MIRNGEKHYRWTGDAVSYRAVHKWVRKYKPHSDVCEKCNMPHYRLEIANISGEYKRDINDYIWICPKCHMVLDGKKEKNRLAHLGKKHSEETKRKLSELNAGENNHFYGKHHSEETKQKMKGRYVSKETRQKMRMASLGRHHSEETKQKCRLASLGRKMSDEAKQKISMANKGKKPMLGKHMSEETKRKLSELNMGVNHPMYGKHYSDEVKQRMREAQKKRRSQEKA